MYSPSGHTIVVNASFISTTLNNNSWAMISQVSTSGQAQNYWNVGDVKYITLNGQIGSKLTLSNQTFGVFILGFNHNSAMEGSGISFGTFKTTSGVDVCLSEDGTNYPYGRDGTKIFNTNHWGIPDEGYCSGWKAIDLRYDILGSTNVAPAYYGYAKGMVDGYDATSSCATSPVSNTLMAALPSDLRAVMKPITKYTDNVGATADVESNISASIEYLPLLSEYEVHGYRTYANPYEWKYQQRYQYYTNGNSKIKYTHSSTSTARRWWTRSPQYRGGGDLYCTVGPNAGAGSCNSIMSSGVACVFLV